MNWDFIWGFVTGMNILIIVQDYRRNRNEHRERLAEISKIGE